MNRILTLFVFVLLSSTLFARDVVLVLDCSGSMRTYGRWQPDAVGVAEALVQGTAIPLEAWDVTGNRSVLEEFRVAPGDSLYILRFGSIDQKQWPFFSSLEKLGSGEDLKVKFPESSDSFKQGKTNKSLAIAVGGSVSRTREHSADLIVISDFLIDSDMTPDEMQFVNDFEASTTSATPVTLAWHQNQHLQIKFIHIRPAASIPRDGAQVRLLEARLASDASSLDVRWRLDGTADVKNYDLYVRDEKGRIVYSRPRLLGTSASYRKPVSGKLSWYVIATLQDGTQVKSQVGNVIVPGSSPGLPIVMGLLLAAGGVLGYRWWQRKGLKVQKESDRDPQERDA